jgi:hypothetical protein
MANLENDLAVLEKMPVADLERYYKELFKTDPASKNFKFLKRAIAYRLQESALGGLSNETKKKIDEFITTYDPANRYSFKSADPEKLNGRDVRLPMPGSYITKTYKGQKIEVKVLERGFEYEGKFYRNLSVIANTITGAHWSGYGFFGIRSDEKWKKKKQKSSVVPSTPENPQLKD